MKRIYSLILMLISLNLWAMPAENPTMMNQTYLLRVLGGLILVLLMIVALSWLVKKINGVNIGTGKGFQLISAMTLGPKERVMLIKFRSRYLLLGVGSASVNLLHDFGQDLPEEDAIANKTSFADMLKSAVGKT